jgi:hypothetical protein
MVVDFDLSTGSIINACSTGLQSLKDYVPTLPAAKGAREKYIGNNTRWQPATWGA